MSTARQIEANFANAPCRMDHFRPTTNHRLEHGASKSPQRSSRRRTHFPQIPQRLRAAKANYARQIKLCKTNPNTPTANTNPTSKPTQDTLQLSTCCLEKRTQSGNSIFLSALTRARSPPIIKFL